MSSRYSAARPKRAGEAYARSHQQKGPSSADASSSSFSPAGASKKVKFDVRNPSTLAPDAPNEDVVLDADVIGRGHGATKRGAVNIEGYDSDSDNENFEARARQRKTGDVDLLRQMDNYDAKGDAKPEPQKQEDDDEDEDMFAGDDDEEEEGTKGKQKAGDDPFDKKKKSVSFLDPTSIQGAVEASHSGGQVRIDSDGDTDSEDEKKIDDAMVEQGIDDEVGRGGLRHHAPKLEAFNMREEQEEGRFDQDGNYIRKAVDPDAIHDVWLDGVSKKEMRRAAEAHQKRETERRKARLEDDSILTSELLRSLILGLEKGETPLEALARLGRIQMKKRQGKGGDKMKKIPKWKLKKMQEKVGAMDVDDGGADGEGEIDEEQVKIKETIDDITEAADRLMGRDRPDIYDRERELLIREYSRETDEDWVEPETSVAAAASIATGDASGGGALSSLMWEYRWIDGRDGDQKQGPFDGTIMKAWQDAGYFGEGVEFRPAETDEDWTRVVRFV